MRRCGNTTRQADWYIQNMFEGVRVEVRDHANMDGLLSRDKHLIDIIKHRMKTEHSHENLTIKTAKDDSGKPVTVMYIPKYANHGKT